MGSKASYHNSSRCYFDASLISMNCEVPAVISMGEPGKGGCWQPEKARRSRHGEKLLIRLSGLSQRVKISPSLTHSLTRSLYPSRGRVSSLLLQIQLQPRRWHRSIHGISNGSSSWSPRVVNVGRFIIIKYGTSLSALCRARPRESQVQLVVCSK